MKKFPSVSCLLTSHVPLYLSCDRPLNLYSVSVSAYIRESVCHRASLMTLYTAAGGWLRIRAKDHFLFHGKMNDPVWKWLPLASGQLEFAVSQQPSLLCVQRQVLEKERNTRHSAKNQHSTVMVNKLNAFSFSFFFSFFVSSSCFSSCSPHPPLLLPSFHFSHKPGEREKKKSADYRRRLRKGPPRVLLEISIFDLGNHLACVFGPTSWLWSSFRCNLSTIIKGRVNSLKEAAFFCLPSSLNNIIANGG